MKTAVIQICMIISKNIKVDKGLYCVLRKYRYYYTYILDSLFLENFLHFCQLLYVIFDNFRFRKNIRHIYSRIRLPLLEIYEMRVVLQSYTRLAASVMWMMWFLKSIMFKKFLKITFHFFLRSWWTWRYSWWTSSSSTTTTSSTSSRRPPSN